MAGLWCFVISFALVFVTGANGTAHCAQPPDIDVLALTEERIFQTSLIDVPGITEDSIRTMMDAETATNTALREIVDAVADEQSNNPDNPIPASLPASSTGDLDLDIKLNTHLSAYFYTCPYRSWWLLRGSWYFYSKLSDGTRQFYWVFYHWWYVVCGQKYCDNSFQIPWFWKHQFVCFPEYRRVWFWTLCLTIDPNGQQKFTSQLIYRYVPRGCCCKRYWKALTFLQCPVAG